MIKASDTLLKYINGQESTTKLAEKMKVSTQTIYNVLQGDNVSSEVVAKFLNLTGFEFEKAFIVEGDGK